MLRGKQIPYKDEGRDVLLEALQHEEQGRIAVHERQAAYTETTSKPLTYRKYSDMPGISGHRY
jgi:hypothetical protein